MRLYDRFASELAVVLSSYSTVLSIIPVMAGRAAPPKKRRNHKRTTT